MSESKDDEENTMELVKEKAEENGLMINEAKTERLELSREAKKEGSSVTLLGCVIGNEKKAVEERLKKAASAYGIMSARLLNSSSILCLKKKLQLFGACVKSVLLYGLKTLQ